MNPTPPPPAPTEPRRRIACFLVWFVPGFLALNALAVLLVRAELFDNPLFVKRDLFLAPPAPFSTVALGNSRTREGFDPAAFDRSLRQCTGAVAGHSFNFGIEAASAADLLLLNRNVVKQRPPRLLILQTDPEWYNEDDGERLRHRLIHLLLKPSQIPWMLAHLPATREQAALYALSPFLPLLRYREELRDWLVEGEWWTGRDHRRLVAALQPDGFEANDGQNTLNPGDDPPEREDWSRHALLEQIAREAVARDIAVVVVNYPSFEVIPDPLYERQLADRFRAAGAHYISYLADPELRDPRWFIDTGHLNAAGARRFSERLAEDIARVLPAP